MMQTQWPGLGTNFDLSSLDATSGDGRALWPADATFGSTVPPQTPDAVARPWWTCGTGTANSSNPFGGLFGNANPTNAGLFGLVSGLVTMLQQLVGALMNQSTNPNTNTNGQGAPQGMLPGGPQQQFQNVDVSSTGDPHIGEVGTRETAGGNQPVNSYWDSMTAHDDLVHSNQIDGGYRVSTAVTAPDANGVTSNRSATVHANFDQDSITMNRDGSFAIFDDGQQVQLGKGESATLSGGEQVTVNQDGSLKVGASGANGGTIETTLRSTGAGVDVTTHAHELALGGDAVNHGAPARQGGPGHAHHAHQGRVKPRPLTAVPPPQVTP